MRYVAAVKRVCPPSFLSVLYPRLIAFLIRGRLEAFPLEPGIRYVTSSFFHTVDRLSPFNANIWDGKSLQSLSIVDINLGATVKNFRSGNRFDRRQIAVELFNPGDSTND